MTSPTRTTQFPTTLQPDAPMVLDASWRFDRSDRAYIDGQILGIQGVIHGGSFSGNATSIDGVALDSSMLAPPANGFMQQVGGKWAAVTAAVASGVIAASLSVAGDVTGPLATTVVNKINGTSVPASPTATYVLQATSNTTATWTNPSSITAGGISPGTAGQVYITNGTPAATWTSLISVELAHGRFTAGGSGADGSAIIGPSLGGGVNSDLWLLNNGVAATASNFALASDGTNLFVNSTAALGQIIFGGNNTSYMQMNASTGIIAMTGYNVITGGGGISSMTLATNKAGAVLNLNADTNASVLQLAGGTQGGVALGANLAAIGHIRHAKGTQAYVRNSGNTGDNLLWGDDGSNNLAIGNSYSTLAITVASQLTGVAGATIAWESGGDIYLDQAVLHVRSTAHVEQITVTPGTSSSIVFTDNTSAGASISYATRASNAATHDLTIQGQYAFATATLANRTPGNIVFDIGDPTNSGTSPAFFKFTRNSVLLAQCGKADNGSGIGFGEVALWIGAGITPNFNNQTIAVGGGQAYFNAPPSSALYLSQNNSALLLYFPATTTSALFGGSSATAPVQVDWSTSTTPKVQTGTSATSFTIGTNKAAATLTLQADAAASILQFAGGTQNAVALGANIATVGHVRMPNGIQCLARNNANSANYNVISVSTGDILQFGDSANLVQTVIKGGGAPFVSVTASYANVSGTDTYIDSTTLHIRSNGPTEYLAITPAAAAIIRGDATNCTSLTIGTNKAGATLALQGDAAATGILVSSTNIQLCSGTAAYGAGVGVIGITSATTAPTTNPSGGGILYSESGAGKWRGSSGTVTTFGPADLDGFKNTSGQGHCPSCGTDFAHEWHNDKYGSLTVCMKCLTDEIGERPWIVREAA